jgi:hypothetical protein
MAKSQCMRQTNQCQDEAMEDGGQFENANLDSTQEQ